MTVANWVTITVAGLAALASIAGAIVAHGSARTAQNSANNIDRRRHFVEALDRDAESFQVAFNAFIASVTGVIGEPETEIAKKQVGAAIAASTALRIHPRTNADLHTAVVAVAVTLTNTYYQNKTPRHDVSQKLVDSEKAGRAIVVAMATERRDLVADLNGARR